MLKSILATLLALASAVAMAAVDVNQADQAALESVRGVGPALSGKLMDARKQAAFKDWNDLVKRVPGIAEKRAAQLSAQGLTVNGEAYKPGHTQVVVKPADRKVSDTKPAPPPAASGSR